MNKSIRKVIVTFCAAVCALAPMNALTASAAESAYDPVYVIDNNNVVCTANMESINKGNMMWFPAEMLDDDFEGEYPVLVWANGTICPPALYYEFLSEVAAEGYVVVTNTELFAGNGVQQKASIDFILAEDADVNSIFYNKIDETRIGVMGHSQGGMSSVNCAALDSRVDCVFSIAGNSSKSDAKKLTVPTFFATGDLDWIVPSWQYVKPAYNNCNSAAVYANLKGANHMRVCTDPSVYSNYAIKWFNAWLKDDSSAKAVFKKGGELYKDSEWNGILSKNF